MALPTDGFGIYESVQPSAGSGVYQPRLDAIAAGGFALVMNYSLLFGTLAQATAYINYAATKGLKVIVAVHHPAIWRDNTYSTTYTAMYADAGNPGTGTAFMQYIVNGLKALPGVWGWYVGDEPVAGDHTTFATYAAAVRTADSTHPRLIIESATPGASNFYQNASLYVDSCEVAGDDYYPIGNTTVTWASVTTVTTGIQSTCTANSLGSAFVAQAQSWAQYGPTHRCEPYPSCAPWPGYADIGNNLTAVIKNMTPRLVLFYSYFDLLTADNPTQRWSDLTALLANVQNKKFSSFMGHL